MNRNVSLAATRYVDNAATGARNGTSWTDAWTNLAGMTGLSAGDTVFISGGTTSKTYRDPTWTPANGSLGNPITYRIGQESGHNGVAVFDGGGTNTAFIYAGLKHVTISGDYNGQQRIVATNYVGGGVVCDGSYNATLEGIYFDSIVRFNPATNITLTRLTVRPPALTSVAIIWNVWPDGSPSYTNNTIRQCSIYLPASTNHAAWGTDGISGGQCSSVYSNLFSAYWVTNDVDWQHIDGWQNTGGSWYKIYANTFESIGNYSIYWECFDSVTNLLIYNNVFRHTSIYPNTTGLPVGAAVGPQRVNGKVFSNFVIANNTFADFFGRSAITFGQFSTTNTYLNCYIVNNAFINSNPLEFYNSTASRWNTYTNGTTIAYNKSDPRTDGDATFNIGQLVAPGGGATFSFNSWSKLSPTSNFRLLSSDTGGRDVGLNMSAYFTTDADGNVRSGAWDVGAYEYASGTNSPTTDTTAPGIALLTPIAGAVLAGTIDLNATASDNPSGSGVATVTFLVDGIAVGNDTVAPYLLAWNSSSVANGTHTVQAKAQDAAGNQASSASVSVTVQNDTIPPGVMLTAPAAGAAVTSIITLTATASDNPGGSGVARVTFLVDGVAVGTNKVSPYTLAWNSKSVANGSHFIQAKAQDLAGNQVLSASLSVSVQNDTTPPGVILTAPAAGAIISNTATLTASASDNPGGSGVASVTFLVDGVAIGTNTVSPYTLAWNSELVAEGMHYIQARAQDFSGNQTVSANVAVTIQNMLPGPQAVTNGLIGKWSLNEGYGTIAQDSSGRGNHGALVATTNWSQGDRGDCLAFDGTNGYVRVASTPDLEQVTNAVTISVWAQINDNAGMQTVARKVLSEATNLFPYAAYDLVIEDQGSTFRTRMGVTRTDATRGLVYGVPHLYGGWYHFVGTYDGAAVRIYVNGVLEGSTPFTGDILRTSQPLCIGRYGTVTETVKGKLADFRLFNRALSAAEIRALATPFIRLVAPN